MAENIKEGTKTIRSMVSGHSIGQTEESILASGKMGSSMEKELIFCKMDRKKLDNGWKVRE